jgi:hypothetical protein
MLKEFRSFAKDINPKGNAFPTIQEFEKEQVRKETSKTRRMPSPKYTESTTDLE